MRRKNIGDLRLAGLRLFSDFIIFFRRERMFKEILNKVRNQGPRIHNITNYVTANDCANILLACGASPIMSDDADEAEEVTAICDGLNINMGTLNRSMIPAMLLAGKRANMLGHPVVFDPVGAGVSRLRNETARKLINEIKLSVLRGNLSEIKYLALGMGNCSGVDAGIRDTITPETLDREVFLARGLAEKTGAVVSITGAVDIVADSRKAYCIYNGHRDMTKVTGTGCSLSALTAAYVTANPDNTLAAAAAAVCAMGICGEKARARMTAPDGNLSYRNYIIDTLFNLTGEELEQNAKFEIR